MPKKQKVNFSRDQETEDPTIKKSIEERFTQLDSTIDGLSSEKARSFLEIYGKNVLPSDEESLVLKFCLYFWSPLAWAMEVAAILAIIVLDWLDFILIVGLLFLNAIVGFWEEYSSGSAVAALQGKLQPSARCYRDKKLDREFPAVDLVPGDVIALRLGDVIPADCYIIGHDVSAKIDQSTLTGESLPVTRVEGEAIFSGSAVKQGEFKALVYATGINTFLGHSAKLLAQAKKVSHINVVLNFVAYFCITFIIVGCIIEYIVQFGVNKKPCSSVDRCQTINNSLVLIVGGIPIAMPTVLSVMQALGALELSKEGAIVVRLTVVEEIAGMEVLCSDKTGTLTLNRLSVDSAIIYAKGFTSEDVEWTAAMAANTETTDAIDASLLDRLDRKKRKYYDEHKILFYHPFDPVDKWAWAKIQQVDGHIFHAAKGAPQIILERCDVNRDKIRNKVESDILNCAKRGYRTIGVAQSDEKGEHWEMVGLIPLYDPPRHDTKETIENTLALGVSVKMITGDQLAIAVETAKLLGMAGNIVPAEALRYDEKKLRESYTGKSTDELVAWADGFAQVLPEDKFSIVESLQHRHSVIVGMTGDGVNDAPALKKANIGIAVDAATDAARAAADIVLTEPGLSVIVSAIKGSRKIFQRMKSYVTYSVSAAVRIVLTFTLLTCIYDFYFPTIATVFFAILNDGTMITMSRDRVFYGQAPEKWAIHSIFSIAVTIGLYLTLSSVIFYYLIVYTTFWSNFSLSDIDDIKLRGIIYLQVSVSGLAVVFSTRLQGSMFSYAPSPILVIAFCICQAVASILGAYGLNDYSVDGPASQGGTPFGGGNWGWVLATWIWCIIWFIPIDIIKRLVYRFSKLRIRESKDPWCCIPYTLTSRTPAVLMLEAQRNSFEEARRSFGEEQYKFEKGRRKSYAKGEGSDSDYDSDSSSSSEGGQYSGTDSIQSNSEHHRDDDVSVEMKEIND